MRKKAPIATVATVLDFDKTVSIKHSFPTCNAAAMAKMTEEAIIQKGFQDSLTNLRPLIPLELYDMSGEKICAVATHHNNPFIILPYFMRLYGRIYGNTKLLRQEIIQSQQIHCIAIAAFYLESLPRPLFICHITEKGKLFEQARNSLNGKNEMITFIKELWMQQGWADTKCPITYYDDDFDNIQHAASLRNVKAIQVSVARPQFELITPFFSSPTRSSLRLTQGSQSFLFTPKEATETWVSELHEVLQNFQEYKGSLPFGVPISINKPEAGESWYVVFANLNESESFLKKYPMVQNAYTYKAAGWHETMSLRKLPCMAGNLYRYDGSAATRALLYNTKDSSKDKTDDEATVIMEISSGMLQRWVQEHRAETTPSPQSTPSPQFTPPLTSLLSPLSPLSSLSPENRFFPMLTLPSCIELKMAKLVTLNPDLYQKLSVLKDLEKTVQAIPSIGNGCLLFDDKETMDACLEALINLGAKPVSSYEYAHNFDQTIKCLDHITSDFGEYYRYCGSPLTVVDGTSQLHENKFVIAVSPGGLDLFMSAQSYIQTQAPKCGIKAASLNSEDS